MHSKNLTLVIVLFFTFNFSDANANGIKCELDKLSTVEALICQSLTLKNADYKMSDMYSLVLTISSAQMNAEVKKDQIQWLTDRDTCADESCLKVQYAQRIQSLEVKLMSGHEDKKCMRNILSFNTEFESIKDENNEVHLGRVDYNQDGIMDFLTIYQCGAQNSCLNLYIADGLCLKPIGDLLATEYKFIPPKNKKKGNFVDIFLTTSTGHCGSQQLYKFNGTSYVPYGKSKRVGCSEGE